MSTFTECVNEPTFWLSMILAVSIVGIIFHIKERTLGYMGLRSRVIYRAREQLLIENKEEID